MQRELRRIALLVLGWALLLLGVAGLFLPVLQGVLFILLGLYVLSRESEVAHRLFERLRARYPQVDRRVQAIRDRFRGRWGEHDDDTRGDDGGGQEAGPGDRDDAVR